MWPWMISMPQSDEAWVRIPTWIERAGSITPAFTARATKVPWSMRPPSSSQVSWWASNWTSASGPCTAACASSIGRVTK